MKLELANLKNEQAQVNDQVATLEEKVQGVRDELILLEEGDVDETKLQVTVKSNLFITQDCIKYEKLIKHEQEKQERTSKRSHQLNSNVVNLSTEVVRL